MLGADPGRGGEVVAAVGMRQWSPAISLRRLPFAALPLGLGEHLLGNLEPAETWGH